MGKEQVILKFTYEIYHLLELLFPNKHTISNIYSSHNENFCYQFLSLVLLGNGRDVKRRGWFELEFVSIVVMIFEGKKTLYGVVREPKTELGFLNKGGSYDDKIH